MSRVTAAAAAEPHHTMSRVTAAAAAEASAVQRLLFIAAHINSGKEEITTVHNQGHINHVSHKQTCFGAGSFLS